jgi:hypothetical protein
MKKTLTLVFCILFLGCDKSELKWDLEKVGRLPIVITSSATDITNVSALLGGEVTYVGSEHSLLRRGICYASTSNPTIDGLVVVSGDGIGTYDSQITGLVSNTTYYARAFAENSMGVAYGSEVIFTTTNVIAKLPVLTTNQITSITVSTAVSGGNITSDGGSVVTNRGVCYSASQNPTISNNVINSGSGLGAFTTNLTGLNVSTTYYVRAYATNSLGTAYGNQVNFFTSTNTSIPTVASTYSASSVTTNSAQSGGNVTSDGNSTLTAKGVCWSTSSNPTIANNKTNDGSGVGSFTSSITGLSSNTSYYVRAYATNSIGTAYGSEISFTTLIGVPSVTTGSASNIALNTADVDGNITDLGNASVTDHGHCWSTSTNPTVNNSTSRLGSASSTGAFTSNLTGLSNTTYYVRAYATNSYGTSYGNEISFTPICNVPTVSTIGYTITPVPPYWKVEACGRVTDEGSFPVSSVIMWFNTTNPPGAGGGTGYAGLNIDFCISPVKSAGTYYIQAEAKNSCGSGLGSVIQITVP